MAARAVGEQLYQRRPVVAARTSRGPFRRSPDGEKVVAVDPEAGHAVGERLRGERGRLGSGNAREARYGPLVVGDAQDDGSAIDARECQRFVKVAFSGRSF